jgi:hypothetical protein
LLPAGFPVGTYDIESPDAYAPENPLKANIDRFMNQGAPSAIVFGHRNRMLEELGAEIQSGSFKEILGADFFILIDSARFDYLSPRDQFPHFVNVLESTRQFPSDGSPEKTVMQMCELRVLDGNHAIDKLVLNDEMRGKLCLSIFELGDPTLSDQALAQFRASLLYSAPVEVDGLSTWTSPNGTSLSWWERQ